MFLTKLNIIVIIITLILVILTIIITMIFLILINFAEVINLVVKVFLEYLVRGFYRFSFSGFMFNLNGPLGEKAYI